MKYIILFELYLGACGDSFSFFHIRIHVVQYGLSQT
jgi:hypothetical protein